MSKKYKLIPEQNIKTAHKKTTNNVFFKLEMDDINLDEYFYSSKDLTDKVDQKGGYSSLTGERYLKKNIIFGNRTIIKKMKKKYA